MLKRTFAIAAATAALALPIAMTAGPAQADPKHHFIYGTAGDDNLVGTKKSDIIVLFAGNDTAVGGPKNDALLGGQGDDTLYVNGKHSGTDIARGGPGTGDVCYVDAWDRTLGCETVIVG